MSSFFSSNFKIKLSIIKTDVYVKTTISKLQSLKTKSANQYESNQFLIWTSSPDTTTDKPTNLQTHGKQIYIAGYSIDNIDIRSGRGFLKLAKFCFFCRALIQRLLKIMTSNKKYVIV